jgi:hypothetical protein
MLPGLGFGVLALALVGVVFFAASSGRQATEAGGSLTEAGGSLTEAGGSLTAAGGSLTKDCGSVPETDRTLAAGKSAIDGETPTQLETATFALG